MKTTLLRCLLLLGVSTSLTAQDSYRFGAQTGLTLVPFSAAAGTTGRGAYLHGVAQYDRPGLGRLQLELGFGYVSDLSIRYDERSVRVTSSSTVILDNAYLLAGYATTEAALTISPERLEFGKLRLGAGVRWQRVRNPRQLTSERYQNYGAGTQVLNNRFDTGLREMEFLRTGSVQSGNGSSSDLIGQGNDNVLSGQLRAEFELARLVTVYADASYDVNRRFKNLPGVEDRRLMTYSLGVRYLVNAPKKIP